jgi:hypothetical protein
MRHLATLQQSVIKAAHYFYYFVFESVTQMRGLKNSERSRRLNETKKSVALNQGC